jgi:hypothetical protein
MDWSKLSSSLMSLVPIVIALFIVAANWNIQGWILTHSDPKEIEKAALSLRKGSRVGAIIAAAVATLIIVAYMLSIWLS